MSLDNRQQVLAKWTTAGTAVQGFIAAPGSGATITLYDSGADGSTSTNAGARFKRLIVNVISSAASAASGLQFDESHDNGTNWDNLVSYSVSATTYTKSIVSVSAPRVRVRYVNSAAVLTTWRGAVIGDEFERASQ